METSFTAKSPPTVPYASKDLELQLQPSASPPPSLGPPRHEIEAKTGRKARRTGVLLLMVVQVVQVVQVVVEDGEMRDVGPSSLLCVKHRIPKKRNCSAVVAILAIRLAMSCPALS